MKIYSISRFINGVEEALFMVIHNTSEDAIKLVQGKSKTGVYKIKNSWTVDITKPQILFTELVDKTPAIAYGSKSVQNENKHP